MAKQLPKLDDFIVQSITSVLSGIARAQEAHHNIEVGIVSPFFGALADETLPNAMQRIDFEVAVVASEESQTGGSGGLAVYVAEASLDHRQKSGAESSATIRFGVNFVPPMIHAKVNPSET